MHSWYTADTGESWFDSQVGCFIDIWLPYRAEAMTTKEQEERRVAKMSETLTRLKREVEHSEVSCIYYCHSNIIPILCRLWQKI
jgi:hypothetical protein